MKEQIAKLNEQFQDANASTLLGYFLENYRHKIKIATSFGAEDQVVTDLALGIDPQAKLFTLDTGRLHEETYHVLDKTNRKYGISIELFAPRGEDLEALYRQQGLFGFKESIENRKLCCKVRKLEPLKRALLGLDVWVTGLRRAQSPTRESMQKIEWDDVFGLIKINPLIDWNETEVWEYIKKNKLPYNALHDQGFPSIGCAPCTRAIEPGEDIRAGRWWWENPEHKECGLHLRR